MCLKHILTMISCFAVLSMSAQDIIFDTIPSENLACGGASYKLLWLPEYSTYEGEEDWFAAIQNFLDQSTYSGATLVHAQYEQLYSENCWCWFDPEFLGSWSQGISCDCCGGWTTRSFVDYVVVSYESNPCYYLAPSVQEVLCSGCTSPEALNYEENALYDDGTCIFEEAFCETTADLDMDGFVGVSDLLALLSAFGDTDLDFDGIYDSVDDCVGEFDECGVCNGEGPSVPLIESIEILYDSVYAEAIDEWWVFEVGADTSFYFVCELIEGCMDPTAYNYNELANSDDGSCVYQVLGCMDESACNYDPNAEQEDGSCEGLLGCMDPAADNYNAEATCDNETCTPYVGMYGYGGVVFDISGNTAYILNIHEEISTSAFQSEVQAAANALETNGYTNWSVPSSSMTELFCDQFDLISLVTSMNDGIPLSGYYVYSQVGCTVGGVNTYLTRNISSNSCGGSCNCNQCPALLRAIRAQSF